MRKPGTSGFRNEEGKERKKDHGRLEDRGKNRCSGNRGAERRLSFDCRGLKLTIWKQRELWPSPSIYNLYELWCFATWVFFDDN